MYESKIHAWYEFGQNKFSGLDARVSVLQETVLSNMFFLYITICKGHTYGECAVYQTVQD